MKNISCKELSALIDSGASFQLIDVRELHEHEAFNIGGKLIPLSILTKSVDEIDRDKPVIVYCRVGIRSQVAIQRLTGKYPFTNLINLAGGMEAWKKLMAV